MGRLILTLSAKGEGGSMEPMEPMEPPLDPPLGSLETNLDFIVIFLD